MLQRSRRRPCGHRYQRGGGRRQKGEEARGRGRPGEGSKSRWVPPGSGGLRRRRPGFSNSGETEANSATAEQTTLRTALWRKTLSPPQQQERA